MKLRKILKPLRFTPRSEMDVVTPMVEVEGGDDIPEVLKPKEGAAVFLARPLRRLEYIRLGEIIDEIETTTGMVRAYDLVAMVMTGAENVEVEDENGKAAPIDIQFDDKKRVTQDTLDLFEPRDILGFSDFIMDSARLTEVQGEK